MTIETVTVQLTRISCSCGGVYGITQTHYDNARLKGTSWTCPYCHTGWGFAGNGENATLKRKLELSEQSLAHARERMKRVESSRNALRGVVTRTKRRVGAGVCPCCSRTFKQLAAHMRAKHKDWSGEM